MTTRAAIDARRAAGAVTARAVPAAADVDDDVRLPLIVLENGNSKKKKNEEEEEEKERVSEKKSEM